MNAYRFAVTSFVFCMVFLTLCLGAHARYYYGPELNYYDTGAPHPHASI